MEGEERVQSEELGAFRLVKSSLYRDRIFKAGKRMTYVKLPEESRKQPNLVLSAQVSSQCK